MRSLRCQVFRKRASSYLDDELPSRHQRAFNRHRVACRSCRIYMAQVRALSWRLSQLPQSAPPDGLLADTMASFDDLQQASQTGPLAQLTNWVLLHSRAVSTIAAFVITVVCYAAILGQLGPIPDLRLLTRRGSILLSSSQYVWVNELASPVPGAQYYTFPRVQKASHLDSSLAKIDSSMVVLVLVHANGRASLVEVVDPPSNPQIVKQARSALKTIRFRPATTSGQAVPTRLVVVMERIDVSD